MGIRLKRVASYGLKEFLQLSEEIFSKETSMLGVKNFDEKDPRYWKCR
jgi:hypothetical protein